MYCGQMTVLTQSMLMSSVNAGGTYIMAHQNIARLLCEKESPKQYGSG